MVLHSLLVLHTTSDGSRKESLREFYVLTVHTFSCAHHLVMFVAQLDYY